MGSSAAFIAFDSGVFFFLLRVSLIDQKVKALLSYSENAMLLHFQLHFSWLLLWRWFSSSCKPVQIYSLCSLRDKFNFATIWFPLWSPCWDMLLLKRSLKAVEESKAFFMAVQKWCMACFTVQLFQINRCILNSLDNGMHSRLLIWRLFFYIDH